MRAPFGFFVLAWVFGCQGKLREDVHPSPSEEASAFAPIGSAASRHVHYLERAGDRCTLFSLASGVRQLGPVVTCPSDLLDGERVHLAGRACLRESADAARSVPMRCPVDLVDRGESTGGGSR